MFDLKKWLEDYVEQEKVRCPHCKESLSDDIYGSDLYEYGVPISYHGWPDQEDKTIECPFCNQQFKIREHVRRTFDTCKLDEEF